MRPGAAAGLMAFVLVACGARSGLLDSSSASGGSSATSGGPTASTGGTVTTGGSGGIGGMLGGGFGGDGGISGTGAVSGEGGASFDCASVVEVVPRQVVEHPSATRDRNPKLVSTAFHQYAVVFTRHFLTGAPTQLTHATFGCNQCDPKSDLVWPSSGKIWPAFETFASSALTDEFQVTSDLDDQFSALVKETGSTQDGGLSFFPGISISSKNPGPIGAVAGSEPLFVSAGGLSKFLLGTALPGGIHAQVFFGNLPSASAVLGCADSKVVGDAGHLTTEWLAAYSNSKNAPELGCAGVDPGPPTRIDLASISLDGSVTYLSGFDAGAPVARMILTQIGGETWVVYRTMSGGAVAPIRWLRFANIPGPVASTDQGDVTAAGDVPTLDFDATGVISAGGNHLAVAWRNDPGDGSPPRSVLTVLSENGTVLSHTPIEPPSQGPVSIAAQDGFGGTASLFVTWSEPNGSGGEAIVRVARFDCVGAR